MSYAVEKYGAKAIRELLDILMIHNGDLTNQQWREFLLRNKLITRNTIHVRASRSLLRRTAIRRGTQYDTSSESKLAWAIMINNTTRTLFDVQFWVDEVPDLIREVNEIASSETGRATG